MSARLPYVLTPTPPAGNSTYAAITAIVAANVVLVAYIISSVREENAAITNSSASKTEFESRKTR